MSTINESPALAGPLGDCCFKGFKHTGDPVGKKITIAGVETYISEPPADTTGPKKFILFFSDIFGPFFRNAQLIQDYFASQGFTVLGLDYFFGDPVLESYLSDQTWDKTAWSTKAKRQAAEATPRWIDAVREIYGANAKYSTIGYCFGAPYVLELAATDYTVAAAFAHPTWVNEDHFKKITKPLLMICAEIDHSFPAESRRRAEDILVEKKSIYHIKVFSGVEHGFATRGDLEVENIKWAREESARSVVEWFKRFSQ